MIETTATYRIVCDALDCEASPTNEEQFSYDSREAALYDLEISPDWLTTEAGQHVCPYHADEVAAGAPVVLRETRYQVA